MTDITMVLYGAIFVIAGVVVFVIRKYILPWILTKMSASQWNTIVDWAMALVVFAEENITVYLLKVLDKPVCSRLFLLLQEEMQAMAQIIKCSIVVILRHLDLIKLL